MASPIDQLVHYLSQLPGIGEKTAVRLAFFVLRGKAEYAQAMAKSLEQLHREVRFCESCQNLTQTSPCTLCLDAKRESHTLLVVETPQDLMAIERSQTYRGKYHVLHGAISPLEDVNPDDLKIMELMQRLTKENILEIILGTNPNVEGEATALYLTKLLKPLGVKTTRLASGMPVGSGIEYLDALTLQKALEGRMLVSA